ncbi:MAG TPA: DUF2269 family protein [Candidatus Limnocylindrales bacterium]|nr:DUF2269 family protein [Candidatus Limnocylindrales bacterium]
MAWLFPWLLFLHVLAAIAAFGPTFAAPVVASLVAKEPQHANFFARSQMLLSKRLITPLALSLGVTGVLMVLVTGIDLTRNVWLGIAIVLYVIAISFALLVQTPNGARLVELTATPSPGGPSPELIRTAAAVRRGGMLLTLLVVTIVFLMVVKPGVA